ncbi:hypothetical protein H9P43_009451 [Blastocladiella emersonii ATCC 22665]|nr:hypothetical protein H9P43_009451 [Blastocladiella emersonii ATCC 22665]
MACLSQARNDYFTRTFGHAHIKHIEIAVKRFILRPRPEQNQFIRFNVIETGTLMDACGLLNLLVHASPLLATNWEPCRSFVHAWTDYLYTIATSRAEYLRRVTALPLEAFPTLIGVSLYEQGTDDHWSSHTTRLAWNICQVTCMNCAYLYRVEGTLRFTDVAKQEAAPAAVIIMNRLSVIPPSDTSRAHTPVLEVQYMPLPALNGFSKLGRHAPEATLKLFGQIRGKYRLHGPGEAPPVHLPVTSNFASCILKYLELGHLSMPQEGVWNESMFDPAFFKRIQPYLYRSFLIPHYSVHGTEYSVPIPAAPVGTEACAVGGKALEHDFAAFHVDDRIVELE